MAKTIQDIKDQMTGAFIENEVIKKTYGLKDGLTFEQQFSTVSIENILFYIVAVCNWALEVLFDKHWEEVTTHIAEYKPGSLKWYRNMALQFQYGFDLITDTDKFNNEGHTDEEIENSKIVKYSAVTESQNISRLIVKIAGETGGELSPITEPQKEAFEAYMEEIRYAGVPITVINYLPDLLYLNITIVYDPLVLDRNGMAIAPINGNIRPVDTAINDFLHDLPFNGKFSVSKLTDKLQSTAGVIDVNIDSASSAWIDPGTGAYGTATGIYMSTIPESGYYTTKEPNTGNSLVTINYKGS